MRLFFKLGVFRYFAVPFAVLCFSSMLLFTSCEKDDGDSEPDVEAATPWKNRLYSGIAKINGVSVPPLERPESTSYHLTDEICKEDIPPGALTDFTVIVYVPSHPNPEYQAGISANNNDDGLVVGYNGGTTGNIFVTGSAQFIGKISDPETGEDLSGFQVKGHIDNSPVTRENLWYINFPFKLNYVDENLEKIHTSDRELDILNANC